ncbi:MAG: aminodeoxychorismate/anthranilate synthase component II [Rhizobiales bacterium]|nr:aminodeoxychorismate/anthranilate synthase component II [Hyphomicrobiales bacterium]
MILLIDNYDSFTYNLVHYLGELGAETRVVRNDRISVQDIMQDAPDAILLSPGPCTPDKAGICLDLIKTAAGKIPLFGVCLGMQAMGQVFGGNVVPAPKLMHGKISEIQNNGQGVFTGLPPTFSATRYHSLVVDRASFPDELTITAEDSDGTIMGLAHKNLAVHGVQFHPESIASEHGHDILRNFLNIATNWR